MRHKSQSDNHEWHNATHWVLRFYGFRHLSWWFNRFTQWKWFVDSDTCTKITCNKNGLHFIPWSLVRWWCLSIFLSTGNAAQKEARKIVTTENSPNLSRKHNPAPLRYQEKMVKRSSNQGPPNYFFARAIFFFSSQLRQRKKEREREKEQLVLGAPQREKKEFSIARLLEKRRYLSGEKKMQEHLTISGSAKI